MLVLAAFALVASCADGSKSDTTRTTGGVEGRQTTTTQSTSSTSTATTTTGGTTTTAPEKRKKTIVVETPKAFDIVTGRFILSGTADVFEGAIVYTISDGTRTVQKGALTASCGSGCRGTFRKQIVLGPSVRPGNYTLLVFHESAEDGSPRDAVPIPLTVHAS